MLKNRGPSQIKGPKRSTVSLKKPKRSTILYKRTSQLKFLAMGLYGTTFDRELSKVSNGIANTVA